MWPWTGIDQACTVLCRQGKAVALIDFIFLFFLFCVRATAVYTLIPPFDLGTFQQDVDHRTCLEFPQLYRPTQANQYLNLRKFVLSLLYGETPFRITLLLKWYKWCSRCLTILIITNSKDHRVVHAKLKDGFDKKRSLKPRLTRTMFEIGVYTSIVIFFVTYLTVTDDDGCVYENGMNCNGYQYFAVIDPSHCSLSFSPKYASSYKLFCVRIGSFYVFPKWWLTNSYWLSFVFVGVYDTFRQLLHIR